MGVAMMILGILGAAEPFLPVIEQLLSGAATFVATEFAKLFGTGPAAQVQLEGALATASSVVTTIDADLPGAIAWFQNTFPTIESFVTNETGTIKALFAQSQVMAAHGVSKGSAAKLVENAHGAMAVAKP